MATNGRTQSRSETAPAATAPKPAATAPPPAPKKPEPKKPERRDIDIDGPAEKDPVVETRAEKGPVVEKSNEPVIEPVDPKKALAASKSDLARLQEARRARVIKAGILTAIALVLITFVLQNAEPVGIRLIAWTVSIRLIWVIVVSTLLGAVAGYLVGRPDKRLRLHGPNRRDEDQL
ncbi:MAG: lipopolysaccharide assembly protein LapA domain-containing protein [Acidimicrobiia bacterium]